MPGTNAVPAVPATIDGIEGLYMELTVPSQPRDCEFVLWRTRPGYEGSIHASLPGWRHRLWILDVEGLRFVVVAATAPDVRAQWLGELQAMVDSIQIEP